MPSFAAPADPQAVETTGLTKRFGSRVVVDDVALRVPTGAVYGFLGPNGSGKTTTIRMLLGLVTPTHGATTLLGRPVPKDVAAVLPRVGSLVEGPAFHPHLTGRANLARLDAADRCTDAATAARRIDAALDRVGLLAAAAKKYRAYSLGMRQRLAIAAALRVPRDLLVLDEPTNGLDPQGTREVRALVAGLAEDGATVFVSSHLLSEVEQMCTHVGVMRDGRLVAQGTLQELRDTGETTARMQTPDPASAAAAWRQLGVAHVVADTGSVSGQPGRIPVERLVEAAVRAGVAVRGFTVSSGNLEDVFVALTGEGFDVSG